MRRTNFAEEKASEEAIVPGRKSSPRGIVDIRKLIFQSGGPKTSQMLGEEGMDELYVGTGDESRRMEKSKKGEYGENIRKPSSPTG